MLWFVLIVCSSAALVLCLPMENSKNPIQGLCSSGKLYDGNTQSCYTIAEKGPCGKFMTFGFANNSKVYGECSCRKFENFGCSTRPLVYWKEKKGCYPLFDEGPCRSTEWVTLNASGSPMCEKNHCNAFSLLPQKEDYDYLETSDTETVPSKPFDFSYNGKCYRSETKGYCKEGERLYFVEGSLQPHCYSLQNIPDCSKQEPLTIGSSGVAGCPPGSRLANGECADVPEFD